MTNICIASTFTAEPVSKYIMALSKLFGWSPKITFEDYGQVIPSLLNPSSILNQNQSGINILLLREEDWHLDITNISKLNEYIDTFISAVEAYLKTNKTPMIIVLCLQSDEKRTVLEQKIQSSNLLGYRSLFFVSETAFKQKHFPTHQVLDEETLKIGRIPYTELGFAQLSHFILRKIHAIIERNKKLILLDCDNTLWEGICGEGEGYKEIKITDQYRSFQSFLKECVKKGFLVALVSKNNEEDVWSVFDNHPDMILQRKDLAAWMINWQPKSENIVEISKRLSLGLDSMIFIDDSPIECNEISAYFPEIVVYQFPEKFSLDEFHRWLGHLWAFDKHIVTSEDAVRTKLYQQEHIRQSARSGYKSYIDFIKGLGIKVNFNYLKDEEVNRCFQLIQRTNQFRSTNFRMSVDEINLARTNQTHSFISTHLKDKFGDYGHVGTMIFHKLDAALYIDSFILSCRAINRGVEFTMLKKLAEFAKKLNADKIHVPLVRTSRNEPICKFLEKCKANLSSTVEKNDENSVTYFFDVERLNSFDYSPEERHISQKTVTKSVVKKSIDISPAYNEALEFGLDLQTFVTNVVGNKLSLKDSLTENLKSIWSEILSVSTIPVDTSFFELGGTSLQLVQMFSKIKAEWDPLISYDSVTEHLSVNDLEKIIQSHREENLENIQTSVSMEYLPLESKAQFEQPSSQINYCETRNLANGSHVLLTGATGFLGQHLLKELLSNPTLTIYCLIRCSNKQEGEERLNKIIQKLPLKQEEILLAKNIVVVPGDIGETLFGLSDDEFTSLSSKINVILHNAAKVNFIYPYNMLEKANVNGTRNVLELCFSNKPKALYFVSTDTIFDAFAFHDYKEVFETDDIENGSTVCGGYAQTKWVCEKMLHKASSYGLPICIFRTGPILNDSLTNKINKHAFLEKIICESFKKQIIFESNRPFDGLHVNCLAKVILNTMSQKPISKSNYEVFHLKNLNPSDLTSIFSDVAETYKTPIRVLESSDWLLTMMDLIDKNDPFYLVLQSLQREASPGINYLEFLLKRPMMNNTYTVSVLGEIPQVIECLSTLHTHDFIKACIATLQKSRETSNQL